MDCEVLLFTRGFLLASPSKGGGGFFGIGGSKPGLTALGSALWTDVHRIHVTASQSLMLTCGKDNVLFELVPPLDEMDGWKRDIQHCAIQAHLNLAGNNNSDNLHSLGWQYRLCQTPWFSEAVLDNQAESGYEMTSADTDYSEGLNQLDEYNGLAPLHYAVRLGHTEAIRNLLEAGANPNVADREGKTPMYYGKQVGNLVANYSTFIFYS